LPGLSEMFASAVRRRHPVTMRASWFLGGLAALGLLLGACTGAAEPADEEADTAAELPATRSRPSPSPSPPPPEAEPFAVELTHIDMVSTSHAEIVGVPPPPADHAAVELAADRARRVLERYLDAQFADADTRFSDDALPVLLTARAQEALRDEDRLALGALGYGGAWTAPGPATAQATVLFDGPTVELITLEFEAQLQVGFVARPGTRAVTQRGALVFVPTEDGWRVDAVDVTLDAPPPPPAPGRL
jgi:hypothetical protein